MFVTCKVGFCRVVAFFLQEFWVFSYCRIFLINVGVMPFIRQLGLEIWFMSLPRSGASRDTKLLILAGSCWCDLNVLFLFGYIILVFLTFFFFCSPKDVIAGVQDIFGILNFRKK